MALAMASFSFFRAIGGAIYYSPGTGAHIVYGAIFAYYSGLGGPTSWLGFPTTDEYQFGFDRRSNFERGLIVFNIFGTAAWPY